MSGVVVEPILMHDPVGFLAVGRPTPVEDEGLPHSDPPEIALDDLIAAGRLPETSRRCPIRSGPGRVLLVLVAEEVPVVLRRRPYLALLCTHTHTHNIYKHTLLSLYLSVCLSVYLSI